MPKIFLSHSHADKVLAHELAKQIRREMPRAEVFMSSEEHAIPSGDWLQKVLSELMQADVIIPLITPNSEKSLWVAFEYGYFWGKKGKDYSDYIHLLAHPKASIPSPLNTLQAKDITSLDGLDSFFRAMLGQNYEEIADLGAIVKQANSIAMVTSQERRDQLFGKVLLQQATSPEAKQSIIDWMRAIDILHDAPLNWIGDLQEMKFTSANMQRINLGGNDLQRASFWDANLENAILGIGNSDRPNHLQGADFSHANIKGASFQGAKLDGETKLPNGKNYIPELGLEQLTAKEFGAVIDR